MAKQVVTFSEDGIESVQTVVRSVSDGVAAAELSSKTALALRLLHDSAKRQSSPQDEEQPTQPISYMDSIMGTFTFRCACGRVYIGPWEEARGESIDHCERHHLSKAIRKDLDATYDVIEALVTPSPLYSFEELSQ
jgi:hypothetical protein